MILFALLLGLGFRTAINPVYITGYIKRGFSDTSISLSQIPIIVKGDNKLLAKALTNKNGVFEVSFAPDKEKSFDFFAAYMGFDTILIASVKMFESDTPSMTFLLPAKPKRNTLGQVVCLKCRKADKTYKIRYGDALPTSERQILENGDTVYSPIVDGHYNAGHCVAGLARYYCDRDKIRF